MPNTSAKPHSDTACFIANYHNDLSDSEAIRQLKAMGIQWPAKWKLFSLSKSPGDLALGFLEISFLLVSRKSRNWYDAIMKTRLQELDKMLDDLDAQIMSNFPEGPSVNNWLHNAIAKKVELEIERSRCMKWKSFLRMENLERRKWHSFRMALG